MAGESILSFVPFHLSAVNRLSKVCDWVNSWAGEEVWFWSLKIGLSEATIGWGERSERTVFGSQSSGGVVTSGFHLQLQQTWLWRSFKPLG
jgi:hypothetical protein